MPSSAFNIFILISSVKSIATIPSLKLKKIFSLILCYISRYFCYVYNVFPFHFWLKYFGFFVPYMKQITICFIFKTVYILIFGDIFFIPSRFLIKNIRKSIYLKILFHLSFYPNSLYLKRLCSTFVFHHSLICE